MGICNLTFRPPCTMKMPRCESAGPMPLKLIVVTFVCRRYLHGKTLMAREIELDRDDDGLEPGILNEFELEGLATYNAGARTVSINDLAFQITNRTEVENIPETQLTGNWSSVSGYKQGSINVALEVELEVQDGRIELEGEITEDKTLWGYKANDSSLNLFTGYTNVECVYQGGSTGREVHACRQDD